MRRRREELYARAAHNACDHQIVFELALTDEAAQSDAGPAAPHLPWEIQCVNELLNGAQEALAQHCMTRRQAGC
jgi:hypothetical protein